MPISGTISSVNIDSVNNRYIFSYSIEGEESMHVSILDDSGLYEGPELNIDGFYSYCNSGVAIIYDYDNMYYLNNSSTYSFVNMSNYYTNFNDTSNFVADGYLEEASILLDNTDGIPYFYAVLTNNSFVEGFAPFIDSSDFSKGEVFYQKIIL